MKQLSKKTINQKNIKIILEAWLKHNYIPTSNSKILISDLLDDLQANTEIKITSKSTLIAEIIKVIQKIWPNVKIVLKISKITHIPGSTLTITEIIGLRKIN